MIRSEAIPNVAFGTRKDGDGRSDNDARSDVSAQLGIPSDWATISQVHGSHVVEAVHPGALGSADAVVTRRPGLPIAIATADCVPIGLAGSTSVALVHAGWRGVAAGVIDAALGHMADHGDPATVAVIGPHIGACCYEVGDEVVEAVGVPYRSNTRQGTQSVNLLAAVIDQLGTIETESLYACTLDDDRFASHRRDGTKDRQVAVAWL